MGFGQGLRHPLNRGKAGTPVKIEVHDQVSGELLERAWRLYDEAFRDLNAMTVQRHLMTPAEFDAVMADRRVDKYLALSDDGELLGLAPYTNDLDAVVLISPAYFARRWPQHFERRAVWYCEFVAVPGHQKGVFVDLITELYRRAEEMRGVIGLDVCRFNVEAFHLDRAIAIWLNTISGGRVRVENADSQNYYIYETAPGDTAGGEPVAA
jgi:hypothetical protein